MARFADDIAFAIAPGDLVALTGELGAGKTTFARYLLRALAGFDELEVPSPTFTLEQPYDLPRFHVVHADLYRLVDPAEVDELGIASALEDGAAIVEWPERAPGLEGRSRFDIHIGETDDPATRSIQLKTSTGCAGRLKRLMQIRTFLDQAGWGGGDSRMVYLQGDASARRYARLTRDGRDRAILMDWPRQPDGPPIRDGLPYSRIAHLAESVHAFVAVAGLLRDNGLNAPCVLSHDLDAGLLLIEDLGDAVFTAEIDRGRPQAALWRRATDTLIAMSQPTFANDVPLPGGGCYRVPDIDRGLLEIEISLLADWYWPAAFATAMPDDVREAFSAAWQPLFDRVLAAPRGLMLRDYHSPNLIALDGETAPRDVGLIDFQDAVRGPAAYDLVSLLQDARRDTPADLEATLLDHYCAAMTRHRHVFDVVSFRSVYAILGAQRATKILGIFARLAKRDGKPQYLQHMPRIWGYLERNLAHPDMTMLAEWYDRHIPRDSRARPLVI